MGLWSERVVPRLTDRALSSRTIMELREQTCTGLTGRILEIGFGSGLNVGCYPVEVTTVGAVEPSDTGWKLSARRRDRSSIAVERVGLDAQVLDAADSSYDSALSTFTLCTIPDADQALHELRRVLRPGGMFHFLEHGLSPDERVVGWQHRLEPLQERAFAGCHLTRDVPALVSAAGFDVISVDRGYLPGPGCTRAWSHHFLGRAVRRD